MRPVLLLLFAVPGASLLVRGLPAGGWLWDIANGFGFAALGLLVGLTWVSRAPTGGSALRLHKALALCVAGLTAIHAGVLLLSDPLLLEYLQPEAPPHMIAGLLGALGLGLVTGLAYPRPRQRVFGSFAGFRSAHRAGWILTLAAILWHALGSGFYLHDAPAQLAVLSLAGALPLAAHVGRRRTLDAVTAPPIPIASERATLVCAGSAVGVAVAFGVLRNL
jgi:hypothetical protein